MRNAGRAGLRLQESVSLPVLDVPKQKSKLVDGKEENTTEIPYVDLGGRKVDGLLKGLEGLDG